MNMKRNQLFNNSSLNRIGRKLAVIYNSVSNVFCVSFCFELPRKVMDLEISRHFLNQSEVKQIVTRWHVSSRATRRLHASNSDWFTGLSVSFEFGQ